MSFTHLHVHTEYSLLDGSNKIKEYVARVKELGMNSAAITDHGVAQAYPDAMNAVEKIRKNFDIRETELIQGILEAGVKEGIFAMPDTEITAVVLHHALKGLEVPYIRGIMGDNISQRIKRRDNVMNLIFNGIKIK